jgi:hypothetical protein
MMRDAVSMFAWGDFRRHCRVRAVAIVGALANTLSLRKTACVVSGSKPIAATGKQSASG